jgi:hypothetical protein
MMEAVRDSEMSLNFYETTPRNIPGYRHLATKDASRTSLLEDACHLITSEIKKDDAVT